MEQFDVKDVFAGFLSGFITYLLKKIAENKSSLT